MSFLPGPACNRIDREFQKFLWRWWAANRARKDRLRRSCSRRARKTRRPAHLTTAQLSRSLHLRRARRYRYLRLLQSGRNYIATVPQQDRQPLRRRWPAQFGSSGASAENLLRPVYSLGEKGKPGRAGETSNCGKLGGELAASHRVHSARNTTWRQGRPFQRDPQQVTDPPGNAADLVVPQ